MGICDTCGNIIPGTPESEGALLLTLCPCNERRAGWAEVAVRAFAEEVYHTDSFDQDKDTTIGDLICDMMHWCKHNDVDFERALTNARVNYRTETTGEE